MIIDSRYEVIEQLGIGVWATVYKVLDLRTNKIHALKLFQKLDAQSMYEKFSAEDMYHITQIEHPNIIPVTNFGNYGKHIYYISEFFEGKTLSNFVFKKFNLELLYDIIVQVCYALNALHLHNIIHKDLKPDNIMYTIRNNKPYVKVLDFGFSKIDVEKKQQNISGNLPYVAPEIYLGKGARIQSDFYSLGVTLYKITTGSLPYSHEKITSLIAGNHQNFFPNFPRVLNSNIPPQLEKLIMKLLEKNPDNRYKSIEEILGYINRIQLKKYMFSQKKSAVTTLKYKSYFVREDYAHQLLDYNPIIRNGNGKLVVVIGGEGLGKDSMLSLFRYHLLSDEQFTFDYTCSAKHRDPFFALIKEFHYYVKRSKRLEKDLMKISLKFRKYLYESEEKADKISEKQDELELDYESARNFIFHLSDEKPLVFIIKAGHYLTKDTIDFVNYISNEISERKILIIISVDDPSSLSGLIHTIQFKINPLNINQTHNYVKKILNDSVPLEFSQQIWQRSNGNPQFCRDIIIDLTDKKIIWKENKYNFDIDLSNYVLPKHIKHSIYKRMSYLSQEVYLGMQKLSVCQTPLTKALIQHILQIDERDVFFLIHESNNNELLFKRGQYYYFSFNEAKTRMFNECSEKIKIDVSLRVLEFFKDTEIESAEICDGVIKNALMIEDWQSVRIHRLRLINLYSGNYQQLQAFREICKVIELDFSGKVDLKKSEIMFDLSLFQEKAELTGSIQIAMSLLDSIDNLPDVFEKYYIKASFLMGLEHHNKASRLFEKALQYAITGRQRVSTIINLTWTLLRLNKITKAKKYLNLLEHAPMTPDLKVSYIDRKALLQERDGHLLEAIQFVENFLSSLPKGGSTNYYVKLGSMHNNLAYMYSNNRNIEQAYIHFEHARAIWEKVEYERSLGLVYNNLGDLALKQGDTKTAFEHFDKAFAVCQKVDQKRGQALVYINYGEAYIKLGKFKRAEEYLLTAKDIISSINSTEYSDSIMSNLALTISKVDNFNHYYEFLQEQSPEILEKEVPVITPLVKTYFYYLNNIGNITKMNEYLELCLDQDLFEDQDEEFYYQILGLLLVNSKDYEGAIKNFKHAIEYARKSKSSYAEAILLIRITQCCYFLNDYKSGMDYLTKAKSLIEKYSFEYWNVVLRLVENDLKMLDSNYPFRNILRSILEILDFVLENKLFILEISCYERLFQIYGAIGADKYAKHYYSLYKTKVQEVVKSIPEEDKYYYLEKKQIARSSYKEIQTYPMESRNKFKRGDWQEQLYNLFKLNELHRMKFLIDKTIRNLLAPEKYCLILYDDFKNKGDIFYLHKFVDDDIYHPKYVQYIESSLNVNKITYKQIDNLNTVFVPLKIRTTKVGSLIIQDKGELEFRGVEQRILRVLKLHLTSVLMRIKEFGDLNNRMSLLKQMMSSTHLFFSMFDQAKLEQEIVSFAIDFTQSTCGYLIKKDSSGNYVYEVALDDNKHIIRDYSHISKTMLSEVNGSGQPIFTTNAMLDNTFKSSISVQEYQINNIYCAPINIDNQIYGFLYLDNHLNAQKEMYINREFMEMLLMQIRIAIKNSMQYNNLMEKNLELHSLDKSKDNFIAIVSHELNTPLVSLQGYVHRLRRDIDPGDNAKLEKLEKVENSVNKLLLTTNDIVNLNKYSVVTALDKDFTDVSELLDPLISQAIAISEKRHMNISMELSPGLPKIYVNWEGFHLMIYNLILNSIRFTKDFGSIVVGARLSSFQNEEISGKQSIVLYVQDNGIGIPEYELENVFKKFYELNNLWSHKSGIVEYMSSGLGIGLATSKRIVDLHGGKIWIKSKQNEGTTIFIALPIITAENKDQIISIL